MKIVKYSVGIDISKDSFVSCICQRKEDDSLIFSKPKKFENKKPGFNRLIRWVNKECIEKEVEMVFLMEATGVYYESLAFHLASIKKKVHVVLPNTSKHYFSSLNIKNKTDAIDSKVLSQFGVERRHSVWEPPKEVYRKLRNLTRYCVQLKEQKTALNNIKHSKEEAYDVQKLIIQSNKKIIAQIDKQISKCEEEVKKLIDSDEELAERVRKLNTIKGVAIMTIATIIAETNGFEYIQNCKQLVSYAGYDVVQKESGTSVNGRTRISKKGNRYIRNALYFPAMVACRYNSIMKENYLRIIQKKSSKMIGQVAIQRKLLILIYTLWKNNQEFIEDYEKSNSRTKPGATLSNSNLK